MSVHKEYTALLRFALWGLESEDVPNCLSHSKCLALRKLSSEQTTVGLISQALVDRNVKLEGEDVADVLATIQTVKELNQRLNDAVINLCQLMDKQGIRILVLKGQTYAAFYPDPSLRQCGDIDFVCHPDDIEKAIAYLKYDLGLSLSDSGSNKHARFRKDGILYEIHCLLTNFAYPPSHRYWEGVFMKEVWSHPFYINVDGYNVPTMAPTYNAIYVFEHIFFHLIMDGIGIRQFCDWALLLRQYQTEIDKELLIKHLKGVRLEKAYVGLGAFMVERLGLLEKYFPLSIGKEHYERLNSLSDNISMFGNFGHNVHYISSRGPIHAIEHLVRIGRQVRRFAYLAPMEVLWRIPYMIKWWMLRIIRFIIPCKSIQSVFNRI